MEKGTVSSVLARNAHDSASPQRLHLAVYPHDDFLWGDLELAVEGTYIHWKGGVYQLLGYGAHFDRGSLFPYAAEKIYAIYYDLRGQSGMWARKFFGVDGWNTPAQVDDKEVKRFRRATLVDLAGGIGVSPLEVPADSIRPLLQQVKILSREANKLAQKLKGK